MSKRKEAAIQKHRFLVKRYRVAIILGAVVVLALLTVFVYLLLTQPWPNSVINAEQIAVVNQDPDAAPTQQELRARDALNAGSRPDDPNLLYLPTPVMAEYNGIKLHSPISANNITEVEFHRASNKWTLALTPLLPLADPDAVTAAGGTSRPAPDEQPTGDEIFIGSAVSMDRDDSAGPMDSSIDVGALPGTAVYAPISGIVVLVKSYTLFEQTEDIELHIQQKDHPELDFILLHIEDVLVKPGNQVIAGVTQLASVRNIGDVIDNQLMLFTAEGDWGNHAHLQINDTTYANYNLLKDALNIFE
jgi:hypothetical protein